MANDVPNEASAIAGTNYIFMPLMGTMAKTPTSFVSVGTTALRPLFVVVGGSTIPNRWSNHFNGKTKFRASFNR
jgi:hypothetical protein